MHWRVIGVKMAEAFGMLAMLRDLSGVRRKAPKCPMGQTKGDHRLTEKEGPGRRKEAKTQKWTDHSAGCYMHLPISKLFAQAPGASISSSIQEGLISMPPFRIVVVMT